ncbi:MAG: tetratricopeptide repeat protein [Proteobacteria bacterium]|nr:tetratricopeptide repeat protein [Pseudomonadota bacterium]
MTADGELQAMGQEALQLERAGRLDEAEAAYQRLLARWPDLPDTWFNLAVLQRKARRFEAALASYQQALDRGVSQPEEAHLNRGVIYSDCLRRDEAAAAELRAALALNPTFVPALLNLANLQEDLGQREDALALYERVLAIDPRCHVALARLASLKTATGPDAATVERLRAPYATPGVPSADRASLGSAGAGAGKSRRVRPGFRRNRGGQPGKPLKRRTGRRALRPRPSRAVRRRTDCDVQHRTKTARTNRLCRRSGLRLRHVPVGIDADRAGARRTPARRCRWRDRLSAHGRAYRTGAIPGLDVTHDSAAYRGPGGALSRHAGQAPSRR